MDIALNLVVPTASVFGGIAIGTALVLMISTYAECSKYSLSSALKNGAIAATPCAIAYFFAALFQFVRAPFENLFIGFGLQDSTATNLALGYIIMLFLWPMTVWAAHDTTKAACVPTVDEMSKFKTELLAKLQAKRQTEAANAKPATK